MDNEMNNQIGIATTPKGDSYNQREQLLIQALTQARLEHNSQLEFESLDDYEIPPRTHFSMLTKPAVSIRFGRLEFNCAAVRLFEGVKYIVPMVSRKKKRLVVIPCNEEELSSVEWARRKDNKWISKNITTQEFVENIYETLEWDKKSRYKALGHISNSPSGIILLFDLKEAIMFPPLSDEYIDRKTGEVKKRQAKFFPDDYKGKIGRSYNDYAQIRDSQKYESFEGYSNTAGEPATQLTIQSVEVSDV